MSKRTKAVPAEKFPSPVARVSKDALAAIESARNEAPPQALVDAFRCHASPRKTLTPREIRAAAAEIGWHVGRSLTDLQMSRLIEQTKELPSTIERALSRRDKRTPKSDAPATESVTIRLNAVQKQKALKLAKKAGHKTVPGWVKMLVEGEVGG